MPESDNFIDGIYNYCDRWCERCPFTARCRVYAAEKARENDDPDLNDADNAAFWDGMVKEFDSTASMLENVANEFEMDSFDEALDADDPFADEDVFGDDDDDDAEIEAMLEEHDRRCEEDPLAQNAFEYASNLQRWQEQQQDVLDAKGSLPLPAHLKSGHEEIGIRFGDALEVIGWYQYFIAAKLHRAVPGPDEEEHWLEPESEEAIQTDSNGSAKIAIIALERSISAWSMIRAALPDHEEAIKEFIAQLARLRRQVEESYPNARRFVRPGFDTHG